MMLACVVAEFFKYKVVQSIIVLSCWPPSDQLNFVRQLSQFGIAANFACDPAALDQLHPYKLQGVLYFNEYDGLLEQVKPIHFSNYFIWFLVGYSLPGTVGGVRYDADITFLQLKTFPNIIGTLENEGFSPVNRTTMELQHVYVHPSEGASSHPWAEWTARSGFSVTRERGRILRKRNLKGYPLRISAPVGFYSEDWYNGSFTEYLNDETFIELDSTLRCGYGASMLVIEAMNATDEVIPVLLWASMNLNSSMLLKLGHGEADLSGGILRMLPSRLQYVDYLMPIWIFSVGFTYLAERESSSNMFVEPFTGGVWCCCLAIGVILAVAQRVSSRSQEEKDGSYYAVLASFLQQDASAVPSGISGRWTFIVMSICSMLVHAYYTSAIVSALMSSGRSGPNSLETLADSKYAIASDSYDYMRFNMFDVKTTRDDLEYLKKKKMTSSFYQELERGVQLIQEGNTAYHSEYNQIFPHFKRFTDDQLCKLQYVDTIPKAMTYITTSRDGQWTDSFRSVSLWIQEVGLAKRLQSRFLAQQPLCRSSMLAERVNFGDVASLLGLAGLGVFLSLILLGLEIYLARRKRIERV